MFLARLTARFAAMKDLPSPDMALVTMIDRGAWPSRGNSTLLRRVRKSFGFQRIRCAQGNEVAVQAALIGCRRRFFFDAGCSRFRPRRCGRRRRSPRGFQHPLAQIRLDLHGNWGIDGNRRTVRGFGRPGPRTPLLRQIVFRLGRSGHRRPGRIAGVWGEAAFSACRDFSSAFEIVPMSKVPKVGSA